MYIPENIPGRKMLEKCTFTVKEGGRKERRKRRIIYECKCSEKRTKSDRNDVHKALRNELKKGKNIIKRRRTRTKKIKMRERWVSRDEIDKVCVCVCVCVCGCVCV